MNMYTADNLLLQEILWSDKKNPDFTLVRTKTSPVTLEVYLGGNLLEAVPEDRNNPEYKLLVGRLYNAGIKRKSLEKTFAVARTTMRRWAVAIKSGDVKVLARALSGAGAPRKLTTEVKAFVRMRFNEIYTQTHYDYSKRIRNEIKQVFKISVSSETLRPVFNELKKSFSPESNSRKTPPYCDSGDNADTGKEPPNAIDKSSNDDSPAEKGSDNRRYSDSFSSGALLCNHAGVLIFANAVAGLKKHLKHGHSQIIEWLISILLGAVNIEKTKMLDADSLKFMLGRYKKTLSVQREHLWKFAHNDIMDKLFSFNSSLTGANRCGDFYCDPHGKHYTGAVKILKGWCASSRCADKVLNMDFIHTSDGYPVFVKHTDSFHDLRERFIKLCREFRSVIGFNRKTALTFIIDRGIYGLETFKDIIKTGNTHIITWEKGYKGGTWKNTDINGSFVITRERNNSVDLLRYRFSYIDTIWERNKDMRKIIVSATGPDGKTIEVSILATDMDRNAEEIITLMFKRWIQENDFKYLINHYGINEITSYASTSYRKLAGLIEDKDTASGEYKALQKGLRELQKDLKKSLYTEHMSKRTDKKRQTKIKDLTKQITGLKEKMQATEKKVSRLEAMINEDYRKLNTRAKALMDAIKIIARNIFYKQLQPFKEMYDNNRDDHVMFRNLTRSYGAVIQSRDKVEVVLSPTACYQKKTRSAVIDYLEKLNKTEPEMPDGSERPIRFRLAGKASKFIAITM